MAYKLYDTREIYWERESVMVKLHLAESYRMHLNVF